jgi:uncharacterized protein YdhG (YjbR/CyaY superfamily)
MKSNDSLRFASIGEYYAAFKPEQQRYLREMHAIIEEVIPDASIGIRYNMPAFFDEGVVVYYAAYKNHMGLYPTAFPIEYLKDRLVQYKTSKGTIQFPYDTLPKELIQQIIQVRLAQMKNKRTK